LILTTDNLPSANQYDIYPWQFSPVALPVCSSQLNLAGMPAAIRGAVLTAPPDMSIGRAYWLVMENAGEFVGETTTPLVP